MHVVFVRKSFRPDQDAAARAVYELACSLVEQGTEVTVLSTASAESALLPPGSSEPRLAALPARRAGGIVRFLFAASWWLARRCRQIDLVITLEDPTGVAATVLPTSILSRRRVRHVAWIMDQQTDQLVALQIGGLLSQWLNRVRLAIDTQALRVPEVIVVLGECMRDRMAARLPGRRIEVLPFWQEDLLPPGGRADQDRREGSPVGEEMVVTYSGHATFRHPLQVVLDAARLLEHDPRIRFVLAGTGPEMERALRAPVPANVQRGPVAPRAGLARSLLAADLHLVVLDARATGTCVPSKAYSAMGVGRPVLFIGSEECQVARDLRATESGVVVDGNDTRALALAIEGLRDDPVGRRAMGLKGRRFFEQSRERSVGCRRWVDLVDDLVAHR